MNIRFSENKENNALEDLVQGCLDGTSGTRLRSSVPMSKGILDNGTIAVNYISIFQKNEF